MQIISPLLRKVTEIPLSKHSTSTGYNAANYRGALYLLSIEKNHAPEQSREPLSFVPIAVQRISIKRDSDKGDFRLIGIEIGKPFTA